MTLSNVLNETSINAFGIGMPALAIRWCSGDATDITVNEGRMSLTVNSPVNWNAPMSGQLRKITSAASLRTSLTRADGSLVTASGFLLINHQQAYLRLSRLYAQVLENAGRPGREQGQSIRPVPRYFFYEVELEEDQAGGQVPAHEVICEGGELTIYDEQGFPIDPLAVASAFLAIMNNHQIIQMREPGFDPINPNTTQLSDIAGLAGSTDRRVRLSTPTGLPRDNANLSGLTSIPGVSGIFSVPGGTVGINPVSASFPIEQQRLIWLGPSTNGTLGTTFTLPAIPAGVSLARDFFHLRVIQLDTYLMGEPNTDFPATPIEPRPVVRLFEPVNLLPDGNDVLASASAALSGSPTEALCVAQEIRGDFNTPAAPGAAARWPQFPPATGTPAAAGPLRADLRDQFNASARFLDDGDPAVANIDVVLTLNNLPAEAAVRVYPRKFIPEDYDGRGNGAGGIVPTSGTLSLRLPDPLNLRRPGLPEGDLFIPAVATLFCDIVVVKRTGEKRIYGNLTLPIEAAATGDPTPPATNPFTTAPRRGVSNAGVLGLGSTTSLPSEPLDAIIALTGEGNPRDASRYPTMARRDLLVSGLSGGVWNATLSAGRLSREMHSADQRLGAPGSPGGRETQSVGASTQGGRLAYDIARMAFRRTNNIVDRLTALADATWNEPVELTSGGTGSGTFAGAVLQTIAQGCETPELSMIASLIDPADIPGTFDALVDWLVEKIDDVLPTGTPARSRIINALTNLLNNLKDNNTLNESTRERLYNETLREVISSCFGRRDAQWALRGAIRQARHFIYIESPGIASTCVGDETNPRAVDLFEELGTRITQVPGLHVILCSPKEPDYAPGYEPLAASEVHDRLEIIRDLPTAREVNPRVTAFHPIGFPGRPSALEATVVIVDDVWAMIGSSAFRRRGLTFDGASDLLLTDGTLVNGVSPTIRQLRRSLMAARLGATAPNPSAPGLPPDTNFTRLGDGVESFYVVREMLRAGGLGRIALLWNGIKPGVEPIPHDSVSQALANPEGSAFPLADAIVLALLTGFRSF